MKFHDSTVLFLIRCCYCTHFAVLSAAFILCFGSIITSGTLKSLLLLLLIAACSYFLYDYCLRQIAWGEMTEEGVFHRVLFRKQFYPWSDFLQAGILWRTGRNPYRYNDLVLLKPGGSKRKYRDRFFLLRNSRRLIHIPCTAEFKTYVIRHYGPLDFDLSDGRLEQSIVVD